MTAIFSDSAVKSALSVWEHHGRFGARIHFSKLGVTLDVFDTRRENDCLSNYLWSTCMGGWTIILARSQEVVVYDQRAVASDLTLSYSSDRG